MATFTEAIRPDLTTPLRSRLQISSPDEEYEQKERQQSEAVIAEFDAGDTEATLRCPRGRIVMLKEAKIAAVSFVLVALALMLEGAPDAGQAASAIADFNAMTGHAYVAHSFAEYYESRNLEDFALEAARPAWPRVPGITLDELVEVTQRILDAPASPDCPYYLLILEANVPHPAVTGLIFWPAAGTEPTAAEIIDEALSHRPIAL